MANRNNLTLLSLSILFFSAVSLPTQGTGEPDSWDLDYVASETAKLPEYFDQLNKDQLNEYMELVSLVYGEAAEIIESLYRISKYELAKKLLLKELKRMAQILEGDADPRSPEEQEKWLNAVFEPFAEQLIERYKAEKVSR